MFMPCWAEIGMIGASAAIVLERKLFIASWFFFAPSESTLSILFWTMTIFFIPSIWRASMCSLVWGIGTGSFAAMTSIAPSISAAPASMFVIKLSWPGASTKLTVRRSCVSWPQTGHVGDVE